MTVALTEQQAKALGAGTLQVVKRASTAPKPAQDTKTLVYRIEVETTGSNDDYYHKLITQYINKLNQRQDLRVRISEDLLSAPPASVKYWTATEAAEIAGVSLATACRYLQSKFWKGEKHGNQWRISIDAALPVKGQGKRPKVKVAA